MITFSTLTMRIYTLLYKGPIRPTEVHKNRGAAAWFYHLDSPVPSACGTLQSRNVPNEATWGDCGSDHKTRRHNHQKGWSHYCVRIDIAERVSGAYQQGYNKPDKYLFRWVQTSFFCTKIMMRWNRRKTDNVGCLRHKAFWKKGF